MQLGILALGTWNLYDRSGLVRRYINETEAHDLVVRNADPDVYVVDTETGTEIHWADVCAEPWPGSGPPLYEPYGEPPLDWPYDNGC